PTHSGKSSLLADAMQRAGKMAYNNSSPPIRATPPTARADGDCGVVPRSVSYIPAVPRSPAATTLQTTLHEAEVLPAIFRPAQSQGSLLLFLSEWSMRIYSGRT